jgi:hypothetical protein
MYALSIGLVLIVLGIVLRDRIDPMYVPVVARITAVDCKRYIVNRRTNEYHCTVGLQYMFGKKHIQTSIQTHGSAGHYVGTEMVVYVDKSNPINLYVPMIPRNTMIMGLIVSGALVIVVRLLGYFVATRQPAV